ncbi:hypothetical protein HPB47_016248 [Ixodes persulcatus]|uniref:Uncharacterized protein n=1 Tax=Ixodes persulcatus TaxID=34615 RepID=A0AC60R133_IXOPE|nr:hypothetical protein HPB47_016248 [Ixodes persulcatus]
MSHVTCHSCECEDLFDRRRETHPKAGALTSRTKTRERWEREELEERRSDHVMFTTAVGPYARSRVNHQRRAEESRVYHNLDAGYFSERECPAAYIAETKNFPERIRQHMNDVRKFDSERSAIAEHCDTQDHRTDFANAHMVDTEPIFRRLFLESWQI